MIAGEPHLPCERRTGMRSRSSVVVVMVLVVLVTACTSSTGGAGSATPATNRSTGAEIADAPAIEMHGDVPTVAVRSPVRTLQLVPFTYCLAGRCVDGFPTHQGSVGRSESVAIRSTANTTIHVTMSAGTPPPDQPFAGAPCGRTFSTTLRADNDGRATLMPLGPAGSYRVGLFVNPAAGGDLAVSFDWITTRPGPTNVPRSEVSILANHDGSVDSYGVEFGAPTWRPRRRRDGQRPYHCGRRRGDDDGLTRRTDQCTEGTVAFTRRTQPGCRPHDQDQSRSPTTSRSVLDGVRHTARAVWPRDVDPDCSPCVPLRYSPPLSRLRL